MMPIGPRLAAARQRRGMTQRDLANRVGITQSYISYLEAGERRLDLNLLHKLATALGASPESLIAEPSDPALAPDRKIPVLGSVAAGVFSFLEDGQSPTGLSQTDEYFVDNSLHDPNAFAAVVVGTSMAPRFVAGDRVVFSPAAPVKNGDFVLAKLDAEQGTLKQIFFEPNNVVRLAPLNPNHTPIVTSRQALHSCYKMVRRIERFDD